jgi:hypothetical protein
MNYNWARVVESTPREVNRELMKIAEAFKTAGPLTVTTLTADSATITGGVTLLDNAGLTELRLERATNGTDVRVQSYGLRTLYLNQLGNAVVIGADPGGAEMLRLGGALRINSATMIASATAFTNGAGGAAGTLTNAPAAGNPTKWIPVNDNGTTRYLPAW